MADYWIYVLIGLAVVIFLILCFCLAVANFSFDNFKEKSEEARRYANSAEMSTMEFVKEINSNHLKRPLQIEQCGEYEDHFSAGVIALSSQTMYSNSLASLATIAHELGHAIQYENGQLSKHWQSRKKNRIIGKFFLPFIVIGAIFAILFVVGVLEIYSLYIGIAFFGLSFLIFLVAIYAKYREIKVEKGASKNAIILLKEYLTEPEIKICQDYLNSARLTYWGSLFRTMLGWTRLTKKDNMFD